jgi:hypothetical protein
MNLKVLQGSREILADGTQLESLPVSKRGSIYAMDYKQAAILQGLGYMVSVGAFSTAVGNGTVVDLDQPQYGMIIPSGTTIIPLRMAIQIQAPLLAADGNEVEALSFVDVTAATVAAALDGTWTTTHTPKNMKIQLVNPATSLCTVKSICSANTTSPTESIDLFHEYVFGDFQGTPANAMWTKHQALYEPVNPPFIVGPATLFAYWGGTVATLAFMQFNWIELPSTQVV